ncbi:MAG TPA: twin-arginine translocation signal domain-containing protein [Stellaceae bacterium]
MKREEGDSMDTRDEHEHGSHSEDCEHGSGEGRRNFLKGALLTGGAVASAGALAPSLISGAQAQGAGPANRKNHY